MSEWQPFTGNYEKQWYDVLLPDGEVVECCWPNAGHLHEMRGRSRQWDETSGVKFRPSTRDPWESQEEADARETDRAVVIVGGESEARSASRHRIAALRTIAVAAAMGAGIPIEISNHERDPLWVPGLEPVRRYEPRQPGQQYRKRIPQTDADRDALARAEAKRQRRAARRGAQP